MAAILEFLSSWGSVGNVSADVLANVLLDLINMSLVCWLLVDSMSVVSQ